MTRYGDIPSIRERNADHKHMCMFKSQSKGSTQPLTNEMLGGLDVSSTDVWEVSNDDKADGREASEAVPSDWFNAPGS